MRRYSLEALVTASGLTPAALGRKVGLSGSTLQNARARGFSLDAADRYAVRAGLHPLEVWDDFGLVPCPVCEGLFAPTRKGHVYCSPRCRQRVAARKRWEDPAYRAKRAEYMAGYRREAARVLAAQKRAWREANRERAREQTRESMRRFRAARRENAA